MTEPGTARIQWDRYGTRTVLHADPVISVTDAWLESLRNGGLLEPDGVLRLDTAGDHRYRFVRTEEGDEDRPLSLSDAMHMFRPTCHIFERIETEERG